MESLLITLDKNKGKAKATEYFMEMCGYHKRGRAGQKKMDESLGALDDIYGLIDIKAVSGQCGRDCLRGDKLVCDGVSFRCKALSQVESRDVLEVRPYILTIGDIETGCERVLYQIYYDLWETAFVDVGRDLLREHIAGSLTYPDFALSDSFGPGFFGMPGTDVKKFFNILEAEKIGVSLRPSGFMMPPKSCAGFFLITAKEESLPSRDCQNCMSSGKTCIYCKAGRAGVAPLK